jgi:hypothetical protein
MYFEGSFRTNTLCSREITHAPKVKDQDPAVEQVHEQQQYVPWQQALEYQFPPAPAGKSRKRRNGPSVSLLAVLALVNVTMLNKKYPESKVEWKSVFLEFQRLGNLHDALDLIPSLSTLELQYVANSGYLHVIFLKGKQNCFSCWILSSKIIETDTNLACPLKPEIFFKTQKKISRPRRRLPEGLWLKKL